MERISLKKKNLELARELIQASLDVDLLSEEIAKLNDKLDEQSVEETDGFFKFVSQSRDWAFEYITTVQDGLKKFARVVGPEIKYFNTYGQAIDSAHFEALKKISEAYNELTNVMPEEEGEKNEDR